MNKPTKVPNDLRLAHQLCFPLYVASHTLVRLYTSFLTDLGLTYPQYLVMLTLWENNGLIVTEIGRALRLDSGTLTPLLKRLESMGLVERHRPAHDKRCVMIFLTKQGRAVHQQALAGKLPLLGDNETPGCHDADFPQLRADLYRLIARMDGILGVSKD